MIEKNSAHGKPGRLQQCRSRGSDAGKPGVASMACAVKHRSGKTQRTLCTQQAENVAFRPTIDEDMIFVSRELDL